MPRSRRRDLGVEAFIEEDNAGIEIVDDENYSDDELEDLMATSKEKNKAKARRAEAEAEDVEDEVDEDEDVEDEVDEDEGPEDEVDEDESSGFVPWIHHDDADWELSDAFEAVDKGDEIIIYDLKNNVWYKLMPIIVGELPTVASES